jgi:uncharacterized protein YndB with AHSA1/START domain
MITATSTVTIERPAEEVFDFLADGANDPRWREGVIDIAKAEGTGPGGGEGVGTVYKQTMRGPGGRKIAGDYRVVVFDRPRRFAFEVIAGPARPRGTFDLVVDGPTRTTVTFTMEVEPGGLMRLLSPMISKQVGKEVEAIANLKRVLEG